MASATTTHKPRPTMQRVVSHGTASADRIVRAALNLLSSVDILSFATPKRDSSTARPGPQIVKGTICGKERPPGRSAQNDEFARRSRNMARTPRGAGCQQSHPTSERGR